mgnify:CR=1 FL=1
MMFLTAILALKMMIMIRIVRIIVIGNYDWQESDNLWLISSNKRKYENSDIFSSLFYSIFSAPRYLCLHNVGKCVRNTHHYNFSLLLTLYGL